jgi:hypothetical protein
MTDSTTSAGWLKRTNFSEEAIDPIKATIRLKIARKHASLFIHHNIKEYPQWFPGKKNNVADALSQDFDLSDAELTKALCLHCTSQLPPHFQVVPLPSKIESWLTSLLLQLPMKEQLKEQHMKTKLDPTDDGSNTSTQSASPTTLFSTDSTDASVTSSFAPLQQLSEKEDFQAMLSKPWLLEQSEIPFQVYARPSGSMDNPTHPKTKTFNLASFYNDNTDPMSTMTPNRNTKKPSPSVSLPKLQNERTQNYNEPLDSIIPLQFFLPCNHAST